MPKKAKQSKTQTRTKQKKDPNAPKKFKTAYLFFCEEQRPILKESNPGMKFGEISRVYLNHGILLNEEEKSPYVKKSELDKIKYQKNMKNI